MFSLLLLVTLSTADNTVLLDDGTSVTYEAHQGFLDHRLETYYRYDEDGRPTAFGIKIPADLENAFPRQTEDYLYEKPLYPTNTRCEGALPWDHVQINYNPQGHPGGWTYAEEQEAFSKNDPKAIDELIGSSTWFQRHVDIHFSMVTIEEEEKIVCSGGFPPCKPNDKEFKEFSAYDKDTVPLNFINSPMHWVPGMGTHIVREEGQSYEEFSKQFEFIIGTYNNKVQYWESMVTMTAFETLDKVNRRRLDSEWTLPETAAVDEIGYYPTKLVYDKSTYWGSEEEAYTVEFAGLVFRVPDGVQNKLLVERELCPSVNLGSCSSVKKPTNFVEQRTVVARCEDLLGCAAKVVKKTNTFKKCKKSCRRLDEHDCHLATDCRPRYKKDRKTGETIFKKCK